jgi:hypothetical protein
MRVLFAAAVACLVTPQAAPDAFIAQRDAAAARNAASRMFTVATQGHRRAFRIGEPIPLVLTYDYVPNRGSLKGKPLRHFATVVLDHADGTADPLADWDRSPYPFPLGVCCGVEGGVVGGATPPPKPPPVVLDVLLDNRVRFDVPGTYRLYLADVHDREFAMTIPDLQDPGGPPVVSNILELTITRDERWETETLDAALRVLDTSSEEAARAEAAAALARLDSPRAVDEMTRRYVHDRSFSMTQLFAARDRDRVIADLEALAADPREPVTGADVEVLAVLRLTRDHPEDLHLVDRRAALIDEEARRLQVLARAGRLKAGLIEACRSLAAPAYRPHALDGAVTSGAIAAFPRVTAAALTQVPAAARERLLDRWRPSFTDARLVPLLDGLARGGSEAALRILNDLAPERARPIVLRDLAATTPRWPISMSGALPDATLPHLDAAFLRQLEAAPDSTRLRDALQRIARYASPAIAAEVERALARPRRVPACDVVAPALSYVLRADPPAGRHLIETIERTPVSGSGDCDGDAASVLWAAAEAGWSAGLQTVLEERLAAADTRAATLAARTLSRDGPPSAKDALFRALDASRQGDLQDELDIAITSGAQWRLTDEDFAHLAAGCRLRWCVDGSKDTMPDGRRRAAEPEIYGVYDLESKAFRYMVDGADVSDRQLDTRLAQYPDGTSFHWSTSDRLDVFVDWWADRHFPRVEALAARHGLTLHRSTSSW